MGRLIRESNKASPGKKWRKFQLDHFHQKDGAIRIIIRQGLIWRVPQSLNLKTKEEMNPDIPKAWIL